MPTDLRLSGLRLAAAVLAVLTLALAGLWFLKSGRSEHRVPEDAYLVERPLRSPAPAAALAPTGAGAGTAE